MRTAMTRTLTDTEVNALTSTPVTQALSLNVTVDLAAWMSAYGQTETEARADVPGYLIEHVQHAMVEGLSRLEWFVTAKTTDGSGVTWTATEATRDREALDHIAALLGTRPEWSSPADFLEDIANIVGRTSRPHPGGYEDPADFRAAFTEATGRVVPSAYDSGN